MKRLLYLFTAILAVLVFSCNKSEDDQFSSAQQGELKHSSTPIPFNGSFTGICSTVAGDCGTGWIGRHFEGSGNVTHMGKTTCVLDYCFKPEYPTPGPGIDGIFNGPGVMTAANGDELHGYFVGTVTFIWDGNTPIGSSIDADAVLFGGTGRFEGAFGSIHGTGTMDFSNGGVTGSNIPTTLEFTGTIHYGGEYIETTVVGDASYIGSCGTGSNEYILDGEGTGQPLGPIDATMNYCATTTMLGSLPIGGTNTGTGEMVNQEGDELYSEYLSVYRFTYMTGFIINDFIGNGDITGGQGDYESATGKFVTYGTQTIQLGPTGAIFPAPGTMVVIGYIDE